MSDRPPRPEPEILWMLAYAASTAIMLFARNSRDSTLVRADVDAIMADAKAVADTATREVLRKWDNPPGYFEPRQS